MNTRLEYDELIASYARLRNVFSDKTVIRQSSHHLRSGPKTGYYFDFDIMTNDPQACADIVRVISAKLLSISMKRRIDSLAFIEKTGRATVGAVRISAAVSIEMTIPSFIIRLGKELPFEKVKLPSPQNVPSYQKLSNTNTAIVTDHITSGNEIMKTIEVIETLGGKVSDIITYTLKPRFATKILQELLEKHIVVHSIYYLYSLEDNSPKFVQGGTVESESDIPIASA